jgi:hypothetical protein
VLVARRGLGAAEIHGADPAFMAAIRWALFAEKAYEPVPELERVLAQEAPKGMSGQATTDFVTMKGRAREQVRSIRRAIALEETPGG